MRMVIASLVLAACGRGAINPPPVAKPAPPSPEVAPRVPPDPYAALNLGFEDTDGALPRGWYVPKTTYDAASDASVAHGGARSLRLHGDAAAAFVAASTVTPARDLRGKHVAVRGWLKTDAVGGWAGIWLRVDGGEGALDNMEARKVVGTTPWGQVFVELDVPDDGEKLVIGGLLVGAGTAWVDDLRVEVTPILPPKPIVLEGTVVDAAGAPVERADVALVRDAVVAHVTTAADGRFHFDATAGAWGFSAQQAQRGVGAFLDAAPFEADVKDLRLPLGASGGTHVAGKLTGATTAAGTTVEISLTSNHDSDVFVVPVASDGSVTAWLPASSHYIASVREGGVGQIAFDPKGERATFALPIAASVPAPAEVIDWIAGHGIALATAEPGHGTDDLAPLAALVGKARIVALGEATHGTREFFQMKHRLVEYLVSKLGFTVFAIEANQPECRAINDYVLTGKGDAKTALAGIYFWTWDTEEVLAMIEWMRAWNADAAHTAKVQFVGFDMQTARVALANVTAYLAKVGGDPALAAALAPLATEQGSAELVKQPAEVRAKLAAVTALTTAFDAHRKAWTAATSAADFDDMRHDAVIVGQALAMFVASSQTDARDTAMADNLGWLVDHAPRGTRFVVWAHNAHVANHNPAMVNMGSHVRKRYGRDYVNLGFLFGQGAFQAMQMHGAQMSLREITLGPPPDSHASAAFARAGRPRLVLDLRTLPARGIVHDWFASPHAVREVGSTFGTERGMTEAVVLPELYDAVIYVDQTTRARPVRRAQ